MVAGLHLTAGNGKYEGGDVGADLLPIAIFQVSTYLEGFLQVGEKVCVVHGREVNEPDRPVSLVALEASVNEDGEVAVLHHFE